MNYVVVVQTNGTTMAYGPYSSLDKAQDAAVGLLVTSASVLITRLVTPTF